MRDDLLALGCYAGRFEGHRRPFARAAAVSEAGVCSVARICGVCLRLTAYQAKQKSRMGR